MFGASALSYVWSAYDWDVVSPFAVQLRSVVSLVDRFPVLAGVDLVVDHGETLLLTGQNGAGKTSLLRAIAGLLAISGGEATVLGHDVIADRRAVRRDVGYLAHGDALYGDLTARENVTFAMRASKSARIHIEGADGADGALDDLGLNARLRSMPVNRLSSGQRRRVALASLVARDPQLWLLDEPHASLDGDSRRILDSLIREAVARGRTVIFSSHEVDAGRALADRSVVIAGGAVRTDDVSAHASEKVVDSVR